MEHRTEASVPLKLRRSCIFAGQKLQADCLFEAEARNLFQDAGQPTSLQVTGIAPDNTTCTRKTSSQSSTASTLTPHDCMRASKQASCEGLVTTSAPQATTRAVSSVETLTTALSTYPNVKAVIVPKKNSWSRLSITRKMYDELSRRLGIFHAFRETILCMGKRTEEHEVLPPPLKWHTIRGVENLADTPSWECSYVLRFTRLNAGLTSRPWSLRQFAVYEKLSPVDDTSSWVFVDPPEEVTTLFPATVFQGDMPSPEASISTHLALLNNTVTYFRPYMIYLSEEVAKHSRLINFADPMEEDHVDLANNGTRLKLKMLEDDIADALLALRGNQQVADDLSRMWSCCGIPIGTTNEELSVTGTLSQTSRDILHFSLQLQTLKEKLSSCTQIVSSFSDLSNGESLRRLAEASSKESERTAVLSMLTQKDAVAVKALSVIAMIYLPIGVVLNFFSTSFVEMSSGKPVLAHQWWWFLAIGGPLTLVTVVVWYIWLLLHQRNMERSKWFRSLPQASDSEKV